MKIIVERKFLDELKEFEKSLTHKYIRRIPKPTGKGYYYIYKKDFARPIKALLSVFGIKEEKIDTEYGKNKIADDYGVNKQTFAAHILEYLSNRTKWDSFFKSKENRDKYKSPVKTEKKEAEKTESKQTETKTVKKQKTITDSNNEYKPKLNYSLMRKIYAMYNNVPEDKKEEKEIKATKKIDKKAQTDSEMKQEQQKVLKQRKEAGLPDINENKLDARVSAVEDSSWDPNSENYRYKDTGYIAGARKELALSMIRLAGKNKERLRETDIDWEGVEENHRAAKEVIVKSNIFGQVDWNKLKEEGMTGGAAFLIDRVYAQIGKEPSKDSPEARKNYVIAINGLRDRLETAKTVQDVEDKLREIGDEMKGKFRSVKQTLEYKEKVNEISKLENKLREIKDESHRLYEQYNQQEMKENQEIEELKRKWLKDHKVIRANQKYYYSEEKNMSPELKQELATYLAANSDKSKSEQLKKEWFDYREKFGAIKEKDSKYDLGGGRYTYIEYPIEKEIIEKELELKKYAAQEGAKVILQNPLYNAWVQLGDKFSVITTAAWRSKSFYQHKADARRGKYDNWEWMEKDKIEVSRKGTKRKFKFEFLVASEFNRKGGRNITVESTEELKKAFNLRDIQSGNWVLKDPESAKWHVDKMAEGFADLADITGIPDNLISLNGRLAVAIGARGSGGAGAAKAHYESVERVINITKMKGGGSLGHEWFHAFDNMLMEAMGGDEGTSQYFMTNKFAHLSLAEKKLVQEFYESDNFYKKRNLQKKIEKKGIKLPESAKTELQIKVANVFDELVKVMTTGSETVKEPLIISDADYSLAQYNIKENSRTELGKKLYSAGNIDNAMNVINSFYGKENSKNKLKWQKIAAAYYSGKPSEKNGEDKMTVMVDLGKKTSFFLKGAIDLDNGIQDAYNSSVHEMAARAFSAYIDDKLRQKGQFNDYLANYTENKYYNDPVFGPKYPYPEGEERKQINAVFDKLFALIKTENAIKKAIDLIRRNEINKGIFIKGNKILVKKID